MKSNAGEFIVEEKSEKKKIKKAKEISTSEALVDKLIEDGYVTEAERGSINATLNEVTENMSGAEKSKLIRSLADKIDAPGSDLISNNRLNYQSFAVAVAELAKEIEITREEIAAQEEQIANATIENAEENTTNNGLTEEKMEELKNDIHSVYSDFFGLNDIQIPEDVLEEMAKNVFRIEQLDKLYAKYRAEGKSKEDAKKLAMQDLHMTEEELQSDGMKVAQQQVVTKKAQEIHERNGGSKSDSILEVLDQDCLSSESVKKEYGHLGKEIFDALKLAVLTGTHKLVKDSAERTENQIVLKKNINTLDVSELKSEIMRGEERRRVARAIARRVENIKFEKDDETIIARQALYKDLTDEYLATGTTISKLYEKYKNTARLDGIEYEDIFDGIIAELSKDASISFGEAGMLDLKKYEQECRTIDLTFQSVKELEQIAKAKNKKSVLTKRNSDKINELKESQEKDALKFEKLKARLIVKRGIDPNDKKWQEDTVDVRREDVDIQNMSLEEILANRNNVSRDRNAIIRMAKEKDISTNDAAKEYFSEHPEALDSYTKKERDILLGKKQTKDPKVKKNSILKRINGMLLIRNEKSMERLSEDMARTQLLINKLENEPYEASRLAEERRKMDSYIAKMGHLKRSAEKLREKRTKNDSKDAADIFEEKGNKLDRTIIFREYIQSGKTATDLYKELTAKGEMVSFDDIIYAITKESKGYISANNLRDLIRGEKNIFAETVLMESAMAKSEYLRKKDNTVLALDYDKKVERIQKRIAISKREPFFIKKEVGIKMGLIKSEEEIMLENESIYSPRGAETNNQTSSPGIQVEDIKVTKGIIPNIKALCKRAKVTREKMKETRLGLAKATQMSKTNENEIGETEQVSDSGQASKDEQDVR